jgi:hypothetical protein
MNEFTTQEPAKAAGHHPLRLRTKHITKSAGGSLEEATDRLSFFGDQMARCGRLCRSLAHNDADAP